MSHKDSEEKVSRRDVLKTAGASAAAGCLAGGCAPGGSASPGQNRAPGQTPASEKVTGSRVVTHRVVSADVVVVGGGMAGLTAAIAAARNGASVVLVHDRPMLGGNCSSEVRLHIKGADGSGAGKKTDARESGIIEELRLEEAAKNPQRSYSVWDLVMYEWVKREPRILLLLNSHCCGAGMASHDRIGEVLVSRPGTEDLFTVRARQYVDCTGDGRLGAEAGAEFRMGREAQSKYGESMAPPAGRPQAAGPFDFDDHPPV